MASSSCSAKQSMGQRAPFPDLTWMAEMEQFVTLLHASNGTYYRYIGCRRLAQACKQWVSLSRQPSGELTRYIEVLRSYRPAVTSQSYYLVCSTFPSRPIAWISGGSSCQYVLHSMCKNTAMLSLSGVQLPTKTQPCPLVTWFPVLLWLVFGWTSLHRRQWLSVVAFGSAGKEPASFGST